MLYFIQIEIGIEKAFPLTVEMQSHGKKIEPSLLGRVAEIRLSKVQRSSFLFQSQSQNQVKKLGIMIKTIKISFKKYLESKTAQVVAEYCLVLVVVAAIVSTLCLNNFGSIQEMFNTTTSRVVTRITEAPPAP